LGSLKDLVKVLVAHDSVSRGRQLCCEDCWQLGWLRHLVFELCLLDLTEVPRYSGNAAPPLQYHCNEAPPLGEPHAQRAPAGLTGSDPTGSATYSPTVLGARDLPTGWIGVSLGVHSSQAWSASGRVRGDRGSLGSHGERNPGFCPRGKLLVPQYSRQPTR
jgi:hypothetical protein